MLGHTRDALIWLSVLKYHPSLVSQRDNAKRRFELEARVAICKRRRAKGAMNATRASDTAVY